MLSYDTQSTLSSLAEAARRARAQVLGIEKVCHAQHAILVRTALEAFGDDPWATFCIEVLAAGGNVPRPDLILMHPDVGVLVIENKGIALEDIQALNGTTLTILREGGLREEDPFHQAERVMYRLRDLVAQRAELNDLLFLRMVALPRIERAEFAERFKVQWPADALFRDACADGPAFRSAVISAADFLARGRAAGGRLSRRGHEVIVSILTGQSLLSSPRAAVLDEQENQCIGLRIQREELALKQLTPQQADIGQADFRGQHRLFRGVAGSGKSVALSISAAGTVARFAEECAPTLFDPPPRPKRVLVVCYNRTLVHYLRGKIAERYARVAWDAPPASMLTVTHFEALVRELQAKCHALRCEFGFDNRQERAKHMAAALDALPAEKAGPLLHDAIYIDEAQDLDPSEIELLLRLSRPDEKGRRTFIVFYDNAQNIYGVTPPVWEKLGVNIVGGRTVFMDQCLRNTREVIRFAFNVLVGSHAPEGQRVTTRTFADVGSLRQRGLVTETPGGFDIHFCPRSGPAPRVSACSGRGEEVRKVANAIEHLIRRERVQPSDILVLYPTHRPYRGTLAIELGKVMAPDYGVRFVDADNSRNKGYPLIEPGVLTVSTIASAKGYDAPIVFLMGADRLPADTQGRAKFYVGATRAKQYLFVSGVRQDEPSLLDEILLAPEATSA